jgi:hypothetical protein
MGLQASVFLAVTHTFRKFNIDSVIEGRIQESIGDISLIRAIAVDCS